MTTQQGKILDNNKDQLAVLQSYSLRDLIGQVNEINNVDGGAKILREDVVTLLKEHDTFFLIYYK